MRYSEQSYKWLILCDLLVSVLGFCSGRLRDSFFSRATPCVEGYTPNAMLTAMLRVMTRAYALSCTASLPVGDELVEVELVNSI